MARIKVYDNNTHSWVYADKSFGKDGTSVTVKSVNESTADGGSNVITFSDGKTVTIKNGSSGSNGSNGVSATHSWNGTILTVTSASGTSSANLKGENGKDGESGVYILSEGESIEDAPEDADVVIAPNSDNVLDLSMYALKTDIPTKPGDIGAQPEGDYALRSEIPTDTHINELINTALGVIENGTY